MSHDHTKTLESLLLGHSLYERHIDSGNAGMTRRQFLVKHYDHSEGLSHMPVSSYHLLIYFYCSLSLT
jgi:hypothetical protein